MFIKKGSNNMKRNIKSKCITLVLAIAMVFTMSMPAFADTTEVPENGPVYFALGDSIGAGCKNTDFVWGGEARTDDQFFYQFNQFGYVNQLYYGKKNTDIYAVPFSFISRIANQINADPENSVNGAYIGLRSKDVCRSLGIAPVREGDYDLSNDFWPIIINSSSSFGFQNLFPQEDLDSQKEAMKKLADVDDDELEGLIYLMKSAYSNEAYEYNKNTLENGIKNADVITIELGENDLTSFLINHGTEIFGAIGDMMEQVDRAGTILPTFAEDTITLASFIQKESLRTAVINGVLGYFTKGDQQKILSVVANTLNSLHGLAGIDDVVEPVNEDLKQVKALGGDFAELAKTLLGIIQEMTIQNQYYFGNLMNYIVGENPDATVVVGTMINPFKDMEVSESSEYGMVLDIMNMVIDPFVNYTNAYIKNNAVVKDTKWFGLFPYATKEIKYYVADISSVSLNPPMDENGVEYGLHPNNEGQQFIADTFVSVIRKNSKYAVSKDETTFYEKILFHLNGHGKYTPDSQTVKYGNTANEPTDPVENGYDFGGWYTDRECTKAFDFGTSVIENLNLYAKWTEKPKYVTPTSTGGYGGGYVAPTNFKFVFDANGHGVAPSVQNVDNGKMAIEPKDPEAEGFIFGGWYTDKACTTAFDFTKGITANTTVYAKWTEEEKFDVEKAAKQIKLKVSTKYTEKGNIKVTASVTEGSKALAEIKDNGYTVKYKFCRSTRKSSNYKKMLTTRKNVYTNTKGIYDKKYYYKAVLLVVDSKGNTVAKTELKDCTYGCRVFHGQPEE